MIGPASSHAAYLKRQRRQERALDFEEPEGLENVGEVIFASVCAVFIGSVMAMGAVNLGTQAMDAFSTIGR